MSSTATPERTIDEALVDELMSALDDAPEAPCEARPSHHGAKPCSQEVTHRLIACQRSLLVCSTAVERLERAMSSGAKCKDHGFLIRTAWKLIPA